MPDGFERFLRVCCLETRRLPNSHIALLLLRFLISQKAYVKRTTPLECCRSSLKCFDDGDRLALGKIWDRDFSEREWRQVSLPSRHDGVGLRSSVATADEAYAASSMSCRSMQAELGIGDHAALGDVVHRLKSGLPVNADQLVVPTALDEFITPKSINANFSPVAALQLKDDSHPVHKIRLNTYSAPGCNRWLESTPSLTLDKHLTSCEFFTTMSLQLGVDVYDGETLCMFRGSISDRAGIHALSCTAGGDVLHRHNEIRDLPHSFCIRARLNPGLEKAGLLDDENVTFEMRRPAEVLLDSPSNRGRNSRVWSKTAFGRESHSRARTVALRSFQRGWPCCRRGIQTRTN